MNIETSVAKDSAARAPVNADLLKMPSTSLSAYLKRLETLRVALDKLAEIGDETTKKGALRLQQQLGDIEPSVTMIGQVKSGKTSLVNAMAGWPNLLPADVNPWTSVVTSLHMTPEKRAEANRATFKFFDRQEWDRLLDKGGRLGELASRAGADEELETVREQIAKMREKSSSRLGRKFELLLGQEHDYGYFDQDLIERYVCLGEDFDADDAPTDTQGRFADITKSADLYLHNGGLPMKMCIRDTPGVNDTFMMREQITIRAIRDSRICVVVLSAHQALSSVDMALIRLISNIKSREVLIFVNRIDELSDPANQVPEIRESIRETLKKHEGPTDAQIVFGSAYWANKALENSLDSLSHDSSLSLFNWAEQELENAPETQSAAEMIWELSGIPALYRALCDRIAEGIGQDEIDKVARKAINLAQGVQATNRVVALRLDGDAPEPLNKEEIAHTLSDIEERSLSALKNQFDSVIAGFHTRIDRSHKSFLDRATAALVIHLERYGEHSVWQYSPMGLRILLRSSYQIFGARTQGTAQKIFETAAAETGEIYARSFGNSGADFKIEPPRVPRVPPPIFLGQTIALDLQGSWWKGWWQRRRGYQAFASSFYTMIMEETDPIVNELKQRQAKSIHVEALDVLREFFSEQRTILSAVADKADADPEDLSAFLRSHGHVNRQKVVNETIATLTQHVA